MKTVRQACVPRPTTFDPARRDTVLDLSDLVADHIDAASFFAENHVTEGMRTLLTEAFRRLEGKSTQGVFKLTQAMGGGKTHNLLALGLLARQPGLRLDVMGGFYRPDDIGPVRVVAFSGRESDAPFGLMEFRENRYDGEQQIVAALTGRQKYTADVAGETFRKKVEARLFTPSTPCGARRRTTVTPPTASRGCTPSWPTTTGHGAKR